MGASVDYDLAKTHPAGSKQAKKRKRAKAEDDLAGISSGRVMRRNFWNGVAPSTPAAS